MSSYNYYIRETTHYRTPQYHIVVEGTRTTEYSFPFSEPKTEPFDKTVSWTEDKEFAYYMLNILNKEIANV